jgi:parallel beta-helix repeat protein
MRFDIRPARPLSLVASLVLAGGVFALQVGPVEASTTVELTPADSIQTAVDTHPPGTTIRLEPGTYAQQVIIYKDGVTLQGEGGAKKVHVVPPLGPGSLCGMVGICVANLGPAPHNVRITGLTVENFSEAGIMMFGADATRVDNVRALNNGGYGVFGLGTTGTRITDSLATGNHEAGFYIGESSNANALIRDNDSHGNGIGVFFRDSRNGRIEGNNLKDNCAGVVILNTSPGAGDVKVTDNTASHNNASCPPGDGPPISGIGVAIVGADHITLRDNKIEHNDTGAVFPVPSGGIVLLPGGVGPTFSNHVTAKDNRVRHNATDIVVLGPLATNVFDDNHCVTSNPSGLC